VTFAFFTPQTYSVTAACARQLLGVIVTCMLDGVFMLMINFSMVMRWSWIQNTNTNSDL